MPVDRALVVDLSCAVRVPVRDFVGYWVAKIQPDKK